MDVADVADGVERGLEARGVERVARGYVGIGYIGDVVGAGEGDAVAAFAEHRGDVDVMRAIVHCDTVVAVEH